MEYNKLYEQWKSSQYLSAEQKAELEGIDQKEILDRFCAPLSFGTAGLRGVVGMGTNRMNVFTLVQAVRAFAQSLPGDALVVVCRDARLSSSELARAAACALCEEGVRVLYFAHARPTPELSFAVRHYGAVGGINITASHNPKEYNGCKFYGSTGAQLGGEDTDRVFEIMEETPLLAPLPEKDFDSCVREGAIMYADCDFEYIAAVLECATDPQLVKDTDLSVVYTPFHGVGGSIMPQVLMQAGLKNVYYEPHQMEPDGNFTTLKNPNPEEGSGFALAKELAKSKDADIIIGTDPDADRVAVCVRDKSGDYVQLTGNRVGALLCDYLLGRYRGDKTPVIIKTIVSTPLAEAICDRYRANCYSTFTGFKNMAEKLEELRDSEQCLMCFEESIGYMIGSHVRDKDGISGTLLICEMAAWYKKQGKTLLDGLNDLFDKYGEYDDLTLNLVRKGVDGAVEIRNMMASLRKDPPQSILGLMVIEKKDYLSGENVHIMGSDVLEYRLQGGSRLLIRPSGTEPKIKIYALSRKVSAQALADALEQRLTAK